MRFWMSLFLAVAVLAVYHRARGNGFVYDDFQYVTENPHVQDGLTPEGAWWALTATDAGNWHPLTWLSLQLDNQLYGLDPWGYHLTNVLLHAANVVLLFGVLFRMTGALWRSALVAALFALHPMHVESVAWVTERKDVLSTFFALLAIGAYARYIERPGLTRYLLVVVCFVLGLLAKPMLVTLPCVLLLLDYWPLGRLWPANPASPRARAPARLVAEKLPLFALAAVSCAVTVFAQDKGGAIISAERLGVGDRVAVSLVGYVKYLSKLFWPCDLAAFYPYPRPMYPLGEVVGAALLLAVLTGAAVLLGRRKRYLAVGWLWFVGTLVPVIGLVQVGSQAMADRYAYVPFIGMYIVLAWGAADIVRGPAARAALAAGAAVVLLLCAAVTWVQLGYWRDSYTLWTHALKVTSRNYIAHNNLGHFFFEKGYIRQARDEFSQAVTMNPKMTDAYSNLVAVYERLGDMEGAVRALTCLARLKPADAGVFCELAEVHAAAGHYPEAVTAAEKALRLAASGQNEGLSQELEKRLRRYRKGLAE
jgi:tetratricopeptide (TPR) repeat protein